MVKLLGNCWGSSWELSFASSSSKTLPKSRKTHFCASFQENFRKFLKVSKRFRTLLNASGRIRMDPNRSEQVQARLKTAKNCENANKSQKKSQKFRECFEVFASFSRFSGLLGPVRTCSDPFGCIRMHLDAFGCVRTLSENFENFRRKNRF